jgi:hypothetical protein
MCIYHTIIISDCTAPNYYSPSFCFDLIAEASDEIEMVDSLRDMTHYSSFATRLVFYFPCLPFPCGGV